jgi:hypothetical protein
MPDVIEATEYLEIGGVPLATPAWRITSLVPLWAGPDLRGDDVTIEDEPGELAYRQEVHSTSYALPGVVWGRKNREGVAYPDVRTGLHANLAALHTALLIPPMTERGTFDAIWHRVPYAANRTGTVKVLGMPVREFAPGAIRITLQIKLMGGVWVNA